MGVSEVARGPDAGGLNTRIETVVILSSRCGVSPFILGKAVASHQTMGSVEKGH